MKKNNKKLSIKAILDAGHIPAGMELFKAGNESQLKTIYKWINESDVYMLILSGRYGSIESNSGKSYTQLITIHTTLNEFIRDYHLIGWIRNTSGNDTTELIKENNTLLKEINLLK